MSATVVVLPGDGIGPEVTAAAEAVLEATGADLDLVHGDVSRAARRHEGGGLPADAWALVEDADAVLFGATTTLPGEPSAVLALRRALDLHASIRPARSLTNRGGSVTDITVVRELTEDLYRQDERPIPGGAEAVARFTEEATRRAAAIAWDHALATRATRCTVAHKATVLPQTHGLFLRIARQEALARGLRPDQRLGDSLAHDLVRDPRGPRVILAPNVLGDILSDVASALAGGLGLAPSASYGAGAPLFEPVHGSAPDIAGTGVANPTAAILSAALLLDHLGHHDAATQVRAAVAGVLQEGTVRTPDLGGTATTADLTRAIARRVTSPEVEAA